MGFFIELALAGIAALFAWRLSRKARKGRQLSVWLWAAGFVCIGAGVLMGAFYRQVIWLLPQFAGDLPFSLSYGLQLFANSLLLCGVVVAYLSGRVRLLAFAAVMIKLAAFVAYLGYRSSFDVVIYDTALTTLPLLALCTYGAWTWKYPYAQWIVVGSFLLLFAVLLHQGRVVREQFFTADDLYHLMQIAVLSLLVRGGWNMRDEPSSKLSRIAFKRVVWRH